MAFVVVLFVGTAYTVYRPGSARERNELEEFRMACEQKNRYTCILCNLIPVNSMLYGNERILCRDGKI